jgi:uncharacterized protein (DUF4415 family)
MARKEPITSYSLDDIIAMRARGEGRSDLSRVLPDAEIEAQVASDPDLQVSEGWQDSILVGLPDITRSNKQLVSIRYSPQVIDYFKATGKGWQTRMDAVLQAFVAKQR